MLGPDRYKLKTPRRRRRAGHLA